MNKLKSRGLYALFALLAPISGAAIGVGTAMLYTFTHLVDVSLLSQDEIDHISPWSWLARMQSEKAMADLVETTVWIIVLSAVIFAASIIILSLMTGNTDRNEDGSIQLNWFDRLWSEAHLALGIFSSGIAVFLTQPIAEIISHVGWFTAYSPYTPDNYVFGIRNGSLLAIIAIGMAILIEIAVLCWTSLVKKIKARELLNRSVLSGIIILIWSWIKSAGRYLRRSCREIKVPRDGDSRAAIKMITRYILLAAVLICFPLFFAMMDNNSPLPFIAMLISVAGASVIIIKKVGKLAEIRSGVIAVKSGNLSQRITVEVDADGPKTDLDKLASDINHISEATDAAVQNEIRNQRLKTDLISNVSHDLRTPLTSMITYLDILDKEGLDSPDAAEHLAVVREKTDRLRTLTDELFEAAKASSGNIPCEIEDIDIAALIDQSLAEMGDRLDAKDLIIKKNIKADNTVVRADGRLMYRVFENMLSNISKYALEGSRVYIDVTPQEDRRLLIEFKNISKAELNISADELMERFTRGDESRNTEGSGLGLAIARDLTTLMGGSFEISIDGDMFKASITI